MLGDGMKFISLVTKKPNKEHHLWIRKETAGSGKKALRLIDAVSKLPNQKEAIYGALDKWSAFEPEFPLIAVAKALEMLKRRRKWLRIIQVYADMEELGVRPDEDTARRIGKAFVAFGQEEKEKYVLDKYLKKWKYIHFNGERVRVRRDGPLA
nr:unnamed protein product [Digitaria exilis]